MRSLSLLLLAVCLAGCSKTLRYQDPAEARILSTQFGAYDLQQCAAGMVDSLLANPALERKLARQFGNAVPVITVVPLRSETLQHVNTKAMTDSIRTRLINAEKFEFVDPSSDDQMIAEMFRDHESILTDPEQVIAFGQQSVSDYVLNGTLVEMREQGRGVREVYYKLTLQLINKRTGKLDWADEAEIRKVQSY